MSRASAAALFDRLTIAAALSLFAFVLVRAVRVPFTYDEAATYERYLDADFLSIFNFELATNHFLNTVLAKACYAAFGDHEVALRAPNLAGYAMYLGFSALLLKSAARPAIALTGFLLLNLNTYLLDFFGLCRGYGLSLGFLMGALFFLARFLDRLSSGQPVSRQLSLSLGFACVAVLANFTVLNLFIAFALVSIGALAARRAASATPADAPASRTLPASHRRCTVRCLPWIAATFIALVLSQDLRLSQRWYEPVDVRLLGLSAAEREQVEVVAIGVTGRPTPLRRRDDVDVWRQERRGDLVRVRIELPISAARDLQEIDVTIGSRRFTDGPPIVSWIGHDEGAIGVFESPSSLALPASRIRPYRRVINWAGDVRFATSLVAYTALGLAVLGVWALLLKAIGQTLVRLRLLTREEWRPFQSIGVWLAALAGAPLYVLQTNAALYFGGNRGLAADTFDSLIEGSLYGKIHSVPISLALNVTVAAFAGSSLVLLLTYRRGRVVPVVRAAAVLALIVITSLAVVAEAVLFKTPYPLSRTALPFIPLSLLFAIFACEAGATLGRAAAALAIAALVAATGLSVYRFAVTANTTYALEWQKDASTRRMMDDLVYVASFEQPPHATLVLGVDWMYSTGAAFYAKKQTAYSIDVVVVPSFRRADFLYVDENNRGDRMNVIRRYPISRSVLTRGGASP